MVVKHLPGDFQLAHISGNVGNLIRFGQWLNGDGFGDYEHARIYIGPAAKAGRGKFIEAQPGGAVLAEHPLDSGIVCWSSGLIELNSDQRTRIVNAAHGYMGTPYSYADYFAIAAKRFHVPHILLDKYIKSSKHMICSQLVAICYSDAGVGLYPYFTGDVTPGDLLQLLKSKGLK